MTNKNTDNPRPSLKNGWEEYDRKVVPRASSAAEREDCRRAFYIGARHLFGILLKASETDDEQAPSRIFKELNGFADEMEVVAAMQEARNVNNQH